MPLQPRPDARNSSSLVCRDVELLLQPVRIVRNSVFVSRAAATYGGAADSRDRVDRSVIRRLDAVSRLRASLVAILVYTNLSRYRRV